MEERQPRKLAVILHADVVDSTTLVQKDESLAHARIQDAFRRFSSTIETYNGVTHELRGDALVAEFARTSDAVAAGLAFQIENSESNARLEDDLQPRLRIGISLGEVVIADHTVTGAGVVLAQRVEQLAEPGGVCITGAIREAVPQYLPLDYSDLGKREAKGFEEPVQVFGASVKAGKQVPPPEPRFAVRMKSRKPNRLRSAGGIAVLVLVVAGLAWWQPWEQREEKASLERMAFSLPDKPSIAVLPFANISDDPNQEYFVDGMTEDLITDLSKLTELFVISRSSVFAYKGTPVEIRQVAEELAVRYVLEGTVRRAGERIRINAQLIDATTGRHLWAERYDGSLTDVFALQDEITQKIVSGLAIKFSPTAMSALQSKRMINPKAHDAFLRGIRHLNVRTYGRPKETTKAREEFQRAIDLDSNYALAYAGLGWAYWTHFALHDPLDGSAKTMAFELAEKSLALTDNALARRLRAKRYFVADVAWGSGYRPDQPQSAEADLRRAVSLEPSNADAIAELAYTLAFAGKSREAAELMQSAMRLNPNFPSWYHRPAAFAHYFNGAYGDAVREFTAWHESEALPKASVPWLAAALAQAGDMSMARQTIRKLQDVEKAAYRSPPTVHQLASWYSFTREEDKELFAAGLRKAGVPEGKE